MIFPKTIGDILKEEREIWPEKMRERDIAVCLMVVMGDIARSARGAKKDIESARGLPKELGNLITSVIRWCDDLGYDPRHCVELALEAQREYRRQEAYGVSR